MNNKQKEILEKYFNIYKDNNFEYELEAWTNGGVNMFIEIDNNKDIIEELKKYINNFDIDEEIDLYRQDKNYKENFKITESVKDFTEWITLINNIIKELEEVK